MKMINLDPAILDQEKIRKARRKHLLRICIIPIALLISMAVFFLSAWVYNAVFFISYNNKNYPISFNITELRFLLNALEPYIADYNQGVSLMMAGEFKKAEDSFTKSLQNNPPEDKVCKIYENLSLSIEKQADESLSNSSYRSAINLYSNAEGILYARGCAGRNGEEGSSFASDIARDRIIDKRKGAVNALNKSLDDDESMIDDPHKREITDEDLDKNKDNSVGPGNSAIGLRYSEEQSTGDSQSCKVEDGDKCW